MTSERMFTSAPAWNVTADMATMFTTNIDIDKWHGSIVDHCSIHAEQGARGNAIDLPIDQEVRQISSLVPLLAQSIQ